MLYSLESSISNYPQQEESVCSVRVSHSSWGDLVNLVDIQLEGLVNLVDIQLEGLVSLVCYTVGGFGESRVLYSWRVW